MLLHHFYTPGLSINSYLLFDKEQRKGVVVDPTLQVETYAAFAKKEGIEIADIIETHVHADFVSGALALKRALANRPIIHCSGMGGEEWIPSYADRVVQDKDEIRCGSLRLQALHTPGHTPEHMIWLVYDEKRSADLPVLSFIGDLLFVGSIGRPDLLGPKTEELLGRQLYQTLFQVLQPLPDFLQIYPAHSAGSPCGKEIGAVLPSTLGYEKQCNLGLVPQDYNKWRERLYDKMPASPLYFSRMKRVNVAGYGPVTHLEALLPLTKEQAGKCLSSCLIVDIRRQEDFASGNFNGSLNIPWAASFPLWAGSVLPEDQELLVVVDRAEDIGPAVQALQMVGVDRIAGVIDLSKWSDVDKKEALAPSPMITAEELNREKDNYYILDVRTPGEWSEGHIAQAHHLELARISRQLADIPIEKPIAVICRSGRRASLAASLLGKERRAKALNVKGGMEAWEKAKFPVVHTGAASQGQRPLPVR